MAWEQKLSAAANADQRLLNQLQRLRTVFDAVAHELVTDPLSVTSAAVDELEAELRHLGDELFIDSDRRDAVHQRVDHGTRLVSRLRDTEAAAADKVALVSLKIAGPLAVPPAVADRFENDLQSIRELLTSGAWADADRGITRWSDRIAAAMNAATQATATADARLDDRAQLRGRLDAYLAKAHASELAEDPEVIRLYNDAHRVLYTAPTDLDVAAELVSAYQAAISTVRSVPQ